MSAVLLLLASAAVIYLACEYFVNGVEWLGRRLALGETATGTLLAAFGTALPETVVTLVAAGFGKSPEQKEIGIGAALGGPLALSTVAYAVVGLALLAKGGGWSSGRCGVAADNGKLCRDQGWFLALFACKLLAGMLVFPLKPWLGLAFLAAYGLYAWSELRRGEDEAEAAPEPLKLRPHQAEPGLAWILLQTLLALAAVFFASRLFVHQLGQLAPMMGLGPQLTALLLSPIATELPETMNAVIWVRQGKERLALANISGAMMIQATIPTAIGLFCTPWLLDRPLLLSGLVTGLAIAALFWLFRRGTVNALALSSVGLFYLLFAASLAAIGF